MVQFMDESEPTDGSDAANSGDDVVFLGGRYASDSDDDGSVADGSGGSSSGSAGSDHGSHAQDDENNGSGDGSGEDNDDEVVMCFTPNTLIETTRGPVPVQDLRPGDQVITRDNGPQEINWIGKKPMSGRELLNAPHLRPVLIRKGALGPDMPERDMMVSPNHRMLVSSERTSLLFAEEEVLVAAKHLVNHKGVQQIDCIGTYYIHLLFRNHEIIMADGSWTESFQPGDYSMGGLGNAQRNEVFELFPDLRHAKGRRNYASARPSLRKRESRLLFR